MDDNYFDLGTYGRTVTTDSAEAQLWFNRGLMWCYGYNHEESIRCFQKAAGYDPDCAMAYWGIAYASGPSYNYPWEAFAEKERARTVALCHRASQTALAKSSQATPIEQALIQTLPCRYQSAEVVSEEGFVAWNDEYAAAMKAVYAAFSDDLDVVTLCAEAIINRNPWLLWNLKTGQPAEGADTLTAVAILEKGMKQVEEQGLPPHPGLLHMYIHVMEMSPTPERALRASDTLRDLVPDAGHLLHMPSHIDILCGDYYNAVVANSRAIAADNKYLQREGALNFYTAYRVHDFHFKLYAALFLGQYKTSLDTAEALAAAIPEELLRIEEPAMANMLESVISMKLHVYIRFGKWQEIVAEPLPQDQELYCHTTAVLHYAKAIAHAAMGNSAAAEAEAVLFEAARARVPDKRYLFNNPCQDVLAVAAEMMVGEIEYRKGNTDRAFAHLRQSVYLDDHLLYAEPWGWMQPARHALGALLLEQGYVEEAEQVYRADLGLDNMLSRPSQHPNNVWSLHGYVECLHRQHKHAEAAAMEGRLNLAKARADVEINASCYCRLGDHCCD
jgi:hypothetical protein